MKTKTLLGLGAAFAIGLGAGYISRPAQAAPATAAARAPQTVGVANKVLRAASICRWTSGYHGPLYVNGMRVYPGAGVTEALMPQKEQAHKITGMSPTYAMIGQPTSYETDGSIIYID